MAQTASQLARGGTKFEFGGKKISKCLNLRRATCIDQSAPSGTKWREHIALRRKQSAYWNPLECNGARQVAPMRFRATWHLVCSTTRQLIQQRRIARAQRTWLVTTSSQMPPGCPPFSATCRLQNQGGIAGLSGTTFKLTYGEEMGKLPLQTSVDKQLIDYWFGVLNKDVHNCAYNGCTIWLHWISQRLNIKRNGYKQLTICYIQTVEIKCYYQNSECANVIWMDVVINTFMF